MREILGPHPSGLHPFGAPPLLGSTLRGPHTLSSQNSTSKNWPKSKLVKVEIGRSRSRSKNRRPSRPATEHADGWWPRTSKGRPHRQTRTESGRGRRRRSTRKDWGHGRTGAQNMNCDQSENRQMVLTLKALLGTSRGLRQDLTE